MIRAGAWTAMIVASLAACSPADARSVGDARLQPLTFDRLAGWTADDHAAAFQAFQRTCVALTEGRIALRPADSPSDALLGICREALSLPVAGPAEARRFFEARFAPFLVVPPSGAGFLTGYFEPDYEASLDPHPDFPAPLLARPDDLVTIPQGATLPGIEPGLQAARKAAEGFEPYPDRAAIEAGALGARARPIAYLRHAAEAFIIHVQGSARLTLSGGGTIRVAYAGRNGHPYTSIGRILLERGRIARDAMSLERLVGWLKANPDEGAAIMRLNRSYIFFRRADELALEDGPVGGAGVPLTPDRSLAVDRTLWSYGLPVWIEADLPDGSGTQEPVHRLMVAQDTGSAILGPARGDYFTGSGPAAGTRAGLIRHPARFVVLMPRTDADP